MTSEGYAEDDQEMDFNRFLVNDGDIFLASYASPSGAWLNLAQGGQWAHCGIVFRYKDWMLEFLPKRFRIQLKAWKARGIVKEGTPLVLEMTNANREPDTNNYYGRGDDNVRKMHITHLQGWHFLRDASSRLGIRQYRGPRDARFYKARNIFIIRKMCKEHSQFFVF